jgi:hypothetical protein
MFTLEGHIFLSGNKINWYYKAVYVWLALVNYILNQWPYNVALY